MVTNLPYHLTAFVGRVDDLTNVTQLIMDQRLVTLVGPGGIGKTRLALQVAAQMEKHFHDGMWMIDFATLCDPMLVLQMVASTLGIREHGEQSLLTMISMQLQSKRLLLLFDNCEHVLTTCVPLIASLLQACPGMHLLTTSRERLKVAGEMVWYVSPLSCPALSTSLSLEQVQSAEAVQLFCDRAASVEPHFKITAQNASTIAWICRHLDGIPLALELAATRIHMFSVQQLAERLNERFRVLTDGSRTASPRQQTLRATLDWGYELLSMVERVIFQRLSVFVGSWTLEAAENMCADEEIRVYHVLDVLTQLVNKSLVIAEEYEEEVRYHFLETIQQYALQHLKEGKDSSKLYARHWNWYLQVAEKVALHLHGDQQAHWFHILEREEGDLRQALERSLFAGQIEVAARIACALGRFWGVRTRLSEARYWYETILACQDLSLLQRVAVLKQFVEILRFQGEYVLIGFLLEERLTLLQTLALSSEFAETLCLLGWNAFYQDECEKAVKYCNEALKLFQQTEDQSGIAQCLSGMALVATVKREYRRAQVLLQEVVLIRRALHDHAALAYALSAQARAAALQGEHALACESCQEALALTYTLKQPFGTAYSLEAAATVASASGNVARAVRLFSAAHTLRAIIGVPLPPSLRMVREREIFLLRSRLAEDLFTEHWEQGKTFSQEQARSEAALALEESASSEGAIISYPAGLSQREVDVLRMVVEGLSDAQVAERLVLSRRTVSTHLRSIYGKIGVTSRHAATRFALEHDLILRDTLSEGKNKRR